MILFDTNILVYARNTDDKRCQTCRTLINQSEKGELQGVIASQNISEFISVSIKLNQINKKDNWKDILTYLEFLQSGSFKIIYPSRETISVFNHLLIKYKTTPRKVFDLFLMAIMLSNGVKKILTYNSKDYSLFSEIQTITPKL